MPLLSSFDVSGCARHPGMFGQSGERSFQAANLWSPDLWEFRLLSRLCARARWARRGGAGRRGPSEVRTFQLNGDASMARKLIVLTSVVALILAASSDAEAGRRRRRCCGNNYGSCCPVSSCAAPCGPSCGAPCGGYGAAYAPSCGAPCGACGSGCSACDAGYGGAPMGSTYSAPAPAPASDAPEPPPEPAPK
ncbi:hypothetical protein Pan44_34020 [Caulifigura coniformis]|uniref:Uncharacterized protein n=1 Tax=Caulifigura coniformis TaxID=2527983 RepID=A0A517SGV2_9PLAN|nr:hypothetical protein Pan44_34020 [Caulifigura coniformis]